MNPLLLPFLLILALDMDRPEPVGVGTPPDAPPSDAPSDAPAEIVAVPRAPEAQVPTGQYTTAAEVRPILGMTKQSWAAVRLYEGQDLVYFTHLLSWRCGLWSIRWGVNGAPATNEVPLEPCPRAPRSPTP